VKDDPDKKSYDVKSWHYPDWDQSYEMKEKPTIYDEWMHVLGHSAELWFHDPNARRISHASALIETPLQFFLRIRD